MKKNDLSILIPVYNDVCVRTVERLSALCMKRQAEKPDFRYEIIVVDDCSSNKETTAVNRDIGKMAHCVFIEKQENTGSAATRNFLATKAHYRWLLYLDCDMAIENDRFIDNYMDDEHEGIVNGGIAIGKGPKGNLRYQYEKRSEPQHTALIRRRNPYQCFRSTNFLADARLMETCRFDERFQKSGYEDVLFGKLLREHHVSVNHIDNPTVMVDFESNSDYMMKIDRSLHTLHKFRSELRGYSRMLTLENNIHLPVVKDFIRLWHRLFGKVERRILCGKHPLLAIFDIYRMGYYLTLTKKD